MAQQKKVTMLVYRAWQRVEKMSGGECKKNGIKKQLGWQTWRQNSIHESSKRIHC